MNDWDELKEILKNEVVVSVGTSYKLYPLVDKLKNESDRMQVKAEKLGDLSLYPEDKFGPMTVLDYFDLVELQADTYTERAIKAEQKLDAIRDIIKKVDRGKRYQIGEAAYLEGDCDLVSQKFLFELREVLDNDV